MSLNTNQTVFQPPHFTAPKILVLEDKLHRVQGHTGRTDNVHVHVSIRPQLKSGCNTLLHTDGFYNQNRNLILLTGTFKAQVIQENSSLNFKMLSELAPKLNNTSNSREESSNREHSLLPKNFLTLE